MSARSRRVYLCVSVCVCARVCGPSCVCARARREAVGSTRVRGPIRNFLLLQAGCLDIVRSYYESLASSGQLAAIVVCNAMDSPQTYEAMLSGDAEDGSARKRQVYRNKVPRVLLEPATALQLQMREVPPMFDTVVSVCSCPTGARWNSREYWKARVTLDVL